MPQVTIPISLDASVTSAYPSKPYGGYKDLAIESTTPTRYGYLWGSLPALAGQTVSSATLYVRERYNYGGGSRTLTAELLSEGFQEATVNYNNRPDVVSGGPTGTKTLGDAADAAGRWWAIDVTTLLQAVASGTAWYGIRLSSNNGTKFFVWSSEADAESRPYLVVEYSGPPEKPTDLSPAGGRAISVARPLHRFGFVDPGDSMAGFQIQWSDSTDFTTPDLDTGEVVSTLPQWTPTEDVSASETIYWRVRVKDTQGLWSDWADPVSFTRTAKGAAALTSPVDEGTVSEPTPPIIWTNAATQTAFQVFILDPATGNVLSDSGKRPGTELSYTVPADVLTSEDTAYQVVVRLWDDVARESIPGDPAYVELSATFTLELSASVDPVVGLAASPLDGVGTLLTWTRATTPDGYMLRVDGQFVGDVIDPASTLVTGTSNRLEWFGATPRKNQGVEVVPIVNGEAASTNPIVSVRPEPVGVWLSGTDGENAICLHTDGDLGDWSPNMVSAVHRGVGSDFDVVRTQSLGSSRVRLSGVLLDVHGSDLPDLDEQVRRANALRNPAAQRLRLAMTNTNKVGVVDNMFIWPENEFGLGVRVDFDFYEQAP